jgi:long-chain acyl-CoA synthetase
VKFLLDRLAANRELPALVSGDQVHTFGQLLDLVAQTDDFLDQHRIGPSAVVAVEGDFSPRTVALLLSIFKRNQIYVPISFAASKHLAAFSEIAQVEHILRAAPGGALTAERHEARVTHPLLRALQERRHPGLVLFSSGSTGKPKAALHDISRLLQKFQAVRPRQSMLAFLLFDHIGGINTLLASLASTSLLVVPQNRGADSVAALIERHRIETLPTTPTFLTLLLLSGAHARSDLSSLKTITYGTEVMPESTLQRLHAALPQARLHQTYGLTEVGILRTKSESDDSLWVRMGGEGYQLRVRDGLLEIKAESAMEGYLNAPSPFTDDGWLMTGDAVEQKGEYFRIFGRRSEMINVGGEKVYPAEVESVLQTMPEVSAVVVFGESNPIMGQIVTALVRLSGELPLAEFRRRMRLFCKDKLAPYKVPQKVELLSASEFNDRFKKIRRPEALGHG